MAKAIWNGAVIAESDVFELIECRPSATMGHLTGLS